MQLGLLLPVRPLLLAFSAAAPLGPTGASWSCCGAVARLFPRWLPSMPRSFSSSALPLSPLPRWSVLPFVSRFRYAVAVRRSRGFVPCSCCSVPGRASLGFCLSCGWVQPVLRSLLPVLLFAGLVLSSCSRRSVPLPPVPAQGPCQVVIGEWEQGPFFIGEPVFSGGVAGRSVWFRFQCAFPASVLSGSVSGLSSGVLYFQGPFPLQQFSGVWGFWVPVGELPAGWQRVQWQAGGIVVLQ